MRDYAELVKAARSSARWIMAKATESSFAHDELKALHHADAVFEAADAIEELLATARSVVHCKDCEWWTKQDASIQGRCARFGFYPTGKFYCASGSMAEPPKGVE